MTFLWSLLVDFSEKIDSRPFRFPFIVVALLSHSANEFPRDRRRARRRVLLDLQSWPKSLSNVAGTRPRGQERDHAT